MHQVREDCLGYNCTMIEILTLIVSFVALILVVVLLRQSANKPDADNVLLAQLEEKHRAMLLDLNNISVSIIIPCSSHNIIMFNINSCIIVHSVIVHKTYPYFIILHNNCITLNIHITSMINISISLAFMLLILYCYVF